ncbi:MAG TPA: LacI family DNA-binding transcriptional regulator [Gaiellaceae bacterium]|nr:LacI family DNA-binding transcriptional regulator [Gaiellaceae bacterium]
MAQRAGVSIATVSRVLNEKGDVRSTTRERVQAAASELGYNVDSVGRALASQRTRLVGVFVGDNAGHRDLSLMFFGKVLAAISRRLSQHGYEPLLLQDADAGGAHRFDAAVVIGVDEDDPIVLDLFEREIPVVGVDVECQGPDAAFVGSDHGGGVRLALAHLRALGHRRIAHIAGATNTLAGAQRLDAFLESCPDQPPEYVRLGDFSSASGYRETSVLLALDEPPTAIVAASDLMALAALQAIWESDRKPGRDVAVVGFDDLEAAALAHPPLTTLRQDRHELGATAAECAIDLVERPDGVARRVVLPVELVVRASSSPA